MVDTPKPQVGIWTLTAPDGRTWVGPNPIKCVALEQRERVPAAVALERIMAAAQQDEDVETEMRRLLTYAVTHSNMRHVASEFWLQDARKVLGLPDSASASQEKT